MNYLLSLRFGRNRQLEQKGKNPNMNVGISIRVHLYICAILLVIIFGATLSAALPEDYQTMLIPQQTVVFGGGGGGGGGKGPSGGGRGRGFTSYCIEHSKLPPAGRYTPLSGNVTFSMSDNSQVGPMSISEAVSKNYIQIGPTFDDENDGGEDGLLALSRGSAGKKIQKAIFDPFLMVPEGVTVPNGQAVPEFARTLVNIAMKNQKTTQYDIWDNGPQLFVRAEEKGVTTYTKLNHRTSASTVSQFLRLPQGGVAILLKDPVGNLIAIDTGFGKEDGEALAKELCAQAERIAGRLLIFATHPDADHIAGLKAHFKDAPCTPSQIIRPLTTRDELAKKFDMWNSLIPENQRPTYEFKDLAVGAMGIAARKGASAGNYLSTWYDFATLNPSIVGKIALLKERGKNKCSLTIFRWKGATTANEHSLVTIFEHDDVKTMQLGDANERVIRELLQALRTTGDYSLHSHVLVWPHHYWCPEDPKIQELLMTFLKAVNPQMIIVTQPKPGTPQDLERLRKLLEQYQKENSGTLIHWLKDQTIKVITQREQTVLHDGYAASGEPDTQSSIQFLEFLDESNQRNVECLAYFV